MTPGDLRTGVGIVETFGPFLVPTVLFAAGVGFYALLALYQRWRGGGND